MEPFLYCPCTQPFQGSKVCKDLVAFIFHLAVDAVDGDLLDESLQSSAVVLHTGTRAERESSNSHHSSYKLMKNTFYLQKDKLCDKIYKILKFLKYLKKTRCFSCLCCLRNVTRMLNFSSDLQI